MKKEILYSSIKQLIEQAKSYIAQNVNTTLVFTNYHIGKIIIENEQQGKEKASYAKKTIRNLSKKLTKEFGSGYSEDNLLRMRAFYLLFKNRISASVMQKSNISNTISASVMRKSAIEKSRKSKPDNSESKIIPLKLAHSSFGQFVDMFKLSWTHYIILMRIDNEDERNFYEIEATQNYWSVRELQRQYNTSLYERLSLSKSKKAIRRLSEIGQVISKPIDMLKEPVILEFLGLKEETEYTESQLETAIINRLENFLLELGKGFLFQGRQQRISFNAENFYIDLVFYNRILKCFVLIDLKLGELKHQDMGQMQMYVNFYDREIKTRNENKTVGIVLCKHSNKAVIEYTLPKENKHIFAREYKLYLPSKKQLQKLLE